MGLVVLSATWLPGQENRWLELSSQVAQLYTQGRYAEAVPLAQEALRVAEATFGSDDTRLADSLTNLGSLYRQQRRYAEAEPLFLRGLQMDDRIRGSNHPAVAEDLNNLALLYDEQGKYRDAEPLYQRALRIREQALGPDDPHVAQSLHNLGSLYFKEGRYAPAEPLLQRAAQLFEKALGPENATVATAWNDLGTLYHAEGKRSQAEALFQQALQVRERVLGPQHPDVANSLDGLAVVYFDQGLYARAEPLFLRALAVREKALGPNHPVLAGSLDKLGNLYQHQGRFEEAERLFERALGIREQALGKEHPDVARSLNSLAGLYREEGKPAQAEPLFLRALQLREKALGPEHPSVAESLYNLALLYGERGRYAEAEPLVQRALTIFEKAFGPEYPQTATLLSTLATLYARQGKYLQAERLYQRALRISENGLGAEHPDVAAILVNLAALDYDQGQYSQAEPLFRRALAILESVHGPDHPDVATLLNNLAVLLVDRGEEARAEPLMQRALQIHRKAFGPGHPAVGTDLSNLAGLYKKEGKYEQAELLNGNALRILEEAVGPEHPSLSVVLENQAALYFAQAKPGKAQPLFARAFDNLLRQFAYYFTYMSEKERMEFLATVSYRFPVYLSFVQQFREQQPELAGGLYDLLLWQKGFIVGSVASMRRQVEASGDPEALELLDQLAAKRTQLAALLNAQPKDRESWRQQLAQLEAEANDLEKQLVARSAAFAQQKKLERATWQQVRDALKPGEAAVEFAHFRFYDGKQWTDQSYYVALVVTPETRGQPAYIVLGEGKQLEGAPLVQFQQGVRARGMEGTPDTVAAGAAPAERAYELFWKPLEPLLVGKKRVYLATDGALSQIPLGLIAAPDGKLLMEQYDLRLLSSTKDLLREEPAPAAKTAVLVGDPAFALDEARQRAALAKLGAPKQEVAQVAALAPGERSRDQGAGTTLPLLPGTGAEVKAVSDLLQQHQWQATAYAGDGALEEAVKQARSPRLLHLATHGFFLPDQQIKAGRAGSDAGQASGLEDPMLRSGLYFAGADRALAGAATSADLDDGVLTAYEATSLYLQGTELVVLSACNTGQGDVKNGEGVFGLRRALQVSGAQAVMMSLWSVPDQETQELMTLFYDKWLAGTEKHEALRQAQLEVRERVKQRYGRDLPYYWGAFVLVGR